MKRAWTCVVSIFALILLILDGKTGMTGAYDGLVLCIRSVIPSLFPFILVSILLTSTLSGLDCKSLYPLGKILRIPKGSESIYLIGILGGYPVGAQAVNDAVSDGTLDRDNGKRMLGFCSNAGPSFLFGILAAKFTNSWAVWLLWSIQIMSSLLTGIILPGGKRENILINRKQQISITSALYKAILVMTSICGWVVIFRVVLAFLTRWLMWLLPPEVQIAVFGIIELANGCLSLDAIQNEALRFIICSAMLSFGGFCVAMQTASVTTRVGFGCYFPGKLIQTTISLILAWCAQFLIYRKELTSFPWICLPVFVYFLFYYRKKENYSSISKAFGV